MSDTWRWNVQGSAIFQHFIIQNVIWLDDSSVATVCGDEISEGLKHAGIHHPLSKVFRESTVASVLCAVKVGQQLTESLAHPHTNTLTNTLSFSLSHMYNHTNKHTNNLFFLCSCTNLWCAHFVCHHKNESAQKPAEWLILIEPNTYSSYQHHLGQEDKQT